MITDIRRLSDGDDLGTVAELIYEADNFVFPYLFNGNKALAQQVLMSMMHLDTVYKKENIYVALMGEQIVGVMVVPETPIKIDVATYALAFESAGAMLDESFERVMREYYFPLENEGKGYFIANLCVGEMWRGQGIAGMLLTHVMSMLDSKKDIYLECISTNSSAISIYHTYGFETLFEYAGFTTKTYTKLIKRGKSEQIRYENEDTIV